MSPSLVTPSVEFGFLTSCLFEVDAEQGSKGRSIKMYKLQNPDLGALSVEKSSMHAAD